MDGDLQAALVLDLVERGAAIGFGRGGVEPDGLVGQAELVGVARQVVLLAVSAESTTWGFSGGTSAVDCRATAERARCGAEVQGEAGLAAPFKRRDARDARRARSRSSAIDRGS